MIPTHPLGFHLFRRLLVVLFVFGSLAALWTVSPSHAEAATHANVLPASTRSGKDTILLIHGFNGDGYGSSGGFNCTDTANYGWGTVLNYLSGYHNIGGQQLLWGRQDFRTIKFYSGDYNCAQQKYGAPPGTLQSDADYNLHNSQYTSHCSNYVPGNEGNNNESIYHLSCLLAWYIHLNFDHVGWNVEIVAHSMGGLIIRNTIYQVTQHKSSSMPSTLGSISDVVTFATPHNGAAAGAPWFVCGGCQQIKELENGSSFINEMYNNAQNPQSSGGTDWTLMGDDYASQGGCDQVVPAITAMFMTNGRKSVFLDLCYNHPDYLTDNRDAFDTTIRWCDGCAINTDPVFPGWHIAANMPHSLHHMMYALWLSNW